MILTPPKLVTVDPRKPFVFLAGPIQGAPDWQREAITHLADDDCYIANPRNEVWHGDFDAQVIWETHYLAQAALWGVIIFWLAKQVTPPQDPLPFHPLRAYAQTSRFELGEWFSRAPYAIAVGIEPGFTGEDYIRHRFHRLGLYPHDSLSAVCWDVQRRLADRRA